MLIYLQLEFHIFKKDLIERENIACNSKMNIAFRLTVLFREIFFHKFNLLRNDCFPLKLYLIP